jgi:hypothetical protein
MSEKGQSRQFGRIPTTSALPPRTDIVTACRHVSKAPERDITGLTLYERGRQLRWHYSNSTPSPLLSKPTRNLSLGNH